MSIKKLHTVWSNSSDHIDKLIIDLKESGEYPDLDDDELWCEACKLNSFYLDDQKINLDIQLSSPIVCIADIGRWNGRFSGYKKIESGNIKDCLYSECDVCTWFVDQDEELKCTAKHHDGTNNYLYRQLKENLSLDDWEDFEFLLIAGDFTEKDLDKYSTPIGSYISKVYGWN